MGYLLPAEYAAFGLTAETADAWVTAASAMMEAYCRRPSLLTASYTERMRVPRRAQTVRLSYGPLVSVDAVKARYARVREDELEPMQVEFAAAFGLPGSWVDVDVATLDVSLPTGEFRFAWNGVGSLMALGSSGLVLANLQQLAVTSVTETALQVDAGTAPPAGGGFEVRRRDAGFGEGGVDLVLRSSVRSFAIPRAAQVERYYVSMYDASGTYSRFSCGVIVNWPVG